MILKLKNPNAPFPQGGWPFKDPKTGFSVNGYEGTPTMHAPKIIAHRRANPHVYPSQQYHWFDEQSVIQEIYQQKLATHPHLFRGFADKTVEIKTKATNKRVEQPSLNCECGALDWKPKYCPTCSGKKLIGWTCGKCGKDK